MDWTEIEHVLKQHPIMNIDPDKALVSIVAAIILAGRTSVFKFDEYRMMLAIPESVNFAKQLIQEASKK